MFTGKAGARQGVGQISTETGALKAYPYGFASRFEGDERGTNPEELLGASHAACFTMAFSFTCDKAGFATNAVDTKAHVRLVQQGDGFLIDRIALTLEATVPGHRRGQVPGARGGRQAQLPVVESAGQRSRDHADGHVAQVRIGAAVATSPAARRRRALDSHDA